MTILVTWSQHTVRFRQMCALNLRCNMWTDGWRSRCVSPVCLCVTAWGCVLNRQGDEWEIYWVYMEQIEQPSLSTCSVCENFTFLILCHASSNAISLFSIIILSSAHSAAASVHIGQCWICLPHNLLFADTHHVPCLPLTPCLCILRWVLAFKCVNQPFKDVSSSHTNSSTCSVCLPVFLSYVMTPLKDGTLSNHPERCHILNLDISMCVFVNRPLQIWPQVKVRSSCVWQLSLKTQPHKQTHLNTHRSRECLIFSLQATGLYLLSLVRHVTAETTEWLFGQEVQIWHCEMQSCFSHTLVSACVCVRLYKDLLSLNVLFCAVV